MYHKATAVIAFTLLASLNALIGLLSSESEEDVEKAKEKIKEIKEKVKDSDEIPDEIKQKIEQISKKLGDEDKANDPKERELRELLKSLQNLDDDIKLSDELKNLYKGIIDSEGFEMNEENTDNLISSMFNVSPDQIRNMPTLSVNGLIFKALSRSEKGKMIMEKAVDTIPAEKKIGFANEFIKNMGGINNFLISVLQSELGDENNKEIKVMDSKIEISEKTAREARGNMLKAALETSIKYGGKTLIGFIKSQII